jgi:hypothetical protein
MDPTDKDVGGNLLNRDRTFNITYKVGSAKHCRFASAWDELLGL